MTALSEVRRVEAAEIAALLDYPALVEALRAAFLDPPVAPDRIVVPLDAASSARLLVMPAARAGGLAVVKLVTVHPDAVDGAVRATLVAIDAATGALRGFVDGHALTVRRTAAASVLAARQLVRPDARVLALLGAGAVAAALAHAYAATFALGEVVIWARRAVAAEALAAQLRAAGLAARAEPDRAAAVARADIVSAATLATAPIVLGDEVRAGTHVDLVGGFTPDMREADDALIARALVVADGPAALCEAGDLAQPIAAGVLDAARVRLLADVIAAPPAVTGGAVTVFKSVGLALEDLAAAELLFDRLDARNRHALAA